jgi:hypothetical protein
MTDLLSSLQIVLQEAGYKTWLTPADRLTAVCFEDESVIGVANIFEDVDTLLSGWRAIEASFLTRFAPRLREAKDKAWNVYSIFLTAAGADENQTRELRQLEENLEQTRKIAACGLNDRTELVTAILPILPLQYQPRLDNEDLTIRLQNRIATIAPAAAHAALDDKIPPAEVVPLLGAEK